MLALLLIVAALAADRLLLSGRWRRADPVRRRWRAWRPRAIGHVRSAPGTYVYVAVLFVTSWILQTSSSRVAAALLQERSTNLHHLAHDPLRVLLSSAFWVGSLRDWLAWVVLLTVFAAPVERWIGIARTMLVFVIGHVGATLVTAAGLWVALRSDLVESSVVNARDVGASYGVAAVAAVLTYRLSGRRRPVYAGALVVFAGGSLALGHDFTDWGHLIALVLGFACYPLVRGEIEPANDRKKAEMTTRKSFTADEARRVGEEIGIDWTTSPFDVEEFRAGMDVELEHGTHDLGTNVTGDDPHVTGKIARAHLNEFADYYTRLARMEEEAKRDWATRGAR